jgi:hypothetical protein
MKINHSTSFSKTKQIALATSGLLLCVAGSVQAAQTLYYSSYSQVYGNLNTNYSSPLLGDVSFTLNGNHEYSWENGNATQAHSEAHASYSVAAGQVTSDPIYNIVTDNGQFGFSYSGDAVADRTLLKTNMVSSVVDSNGNLVNNATSTSLNSYANASWSSQQYIAPTAAKPAGSYGAILIGITLDGNFPALSDPNIYQSGYVQLYGSSSFTDTAGVAYNSSFSTTADPNTWTGGSKTVHKKVLFQFGTNFDISLSQWLSLYNNGNAQFQHTGRISSIELPFGATLESGALQAGIGNLNELFGNVYNSATADAENTNWDFGNNGGGFTPPPEVPVPSAVWLFGSGLIGLLGLRKRKA